MATHGKGRLFQLGDESADGRNAPRALRRAPALAPRARSLSSTSSRAHEGSGERPRCRGRERGQGGGEALLPMKRLRRQRPLGEVAVNLTAEEKRAIAREVLREQQQHQHGQRTNRYDNEGDSEDSVDARVEHDAAAFALLHGTRLADDMKLGAKAPRAAAHDQVRLPRASNVMPACERSPMYFPPGAARYADQAAAAANAPSPAMFMRRRAQPSAGDLRALAASRAAMLPLEVSEVHRASGGPVVLRRGARPASPPQRVHRTARSGASRTFRSGQGDRSDVESVSAFETLRDQNIRRRERALAEIMSRDASLEPDSSRTTSEASRHEALPVPHMAAARGRSAGASSSRASSATSCRSMNSSSARSSDFPASRSQDRAASIEQRYASPAKPPGAGRPSWAVGAGRPSGLQHQQQQQQHQQQQQQQEEFRRFLAWQREQREQQPLYPAVEREDEGDAAVGPRGMRAGDPQQRHAPRPRIQERRRGSRAANSEADSSEFGGGSARASSAASAASSFSSRFPTHAASSSAASVRGGAARRTRGALPRMNEHDAATQRPAPWGRVSVAGHRQGVTRPRAERDEELARLGGAALPSQDFFGLAALELPPPWADLEHRAHNRPPSAAQPPLSQPQHVRHAAVPEWVAIGTFRTEMGSVVDVNSAEGYLRWVQRTPKGHHQRMMVPLHYVFGATVEKAVLVDGQSSFCVTVRTSTKPSVATFGFSAKGPAVAMRTAIQRALSQLDPSYH